MPGREDALLGILRAEAELFAELGSLAVSLRKALLEPDPEAAECAAAQAETLVARFELLERERTRLDSAGEITGPRADAARREVAGALDDLLQASAVSGFTLSRLEDTVAARRAAVASLLGATYLADGRGAGWRATGVALSAEG